jgi:aminotransferase in exopolysaccharide biosynthesis
MFESSLEFIRELYPDRERIGLHEPVFLGNEKQYLTDCIDSTFVSYVGEYVTRFEESVRAYTGAHHAKAMINGTSALHMGLLVSGVGPGDLVLTQSLTFVATANAITYTGATPFFIDVDEASLAMHPDSLRHFLHEETQKKADGLYHKASGKRIAACLPVHVMGHACRIEEIAMVCTEHGIPLIEDAAEAMGSYWKGRHLGTFGDIGVLSFNGNKTITTGCGGMILCKDEELAARVAQWSTTAKKPHPWAFEHDAIGYNYRLSNVSAAIGLAQMEKLDQILASKRATASAYSDFYEHSPFRFIAEPEGGRSNYWLNTIALADEATQHGFLAFMNENGVNCRPLWTGMHELEMFKDCPRTTLPMTEKLTRTLVNLPSSYRSIASEPDDQDEK